MCLPKPLWRCTSRHVVTAFAGIIAVAGRKWLDTKFLPWFGPVALVALVYTIVILYALQVCLLIAP